MSRYAELPPEQYVARYDSRLSNAVLRGDIRPRGLCVCVNGHRDCALETRGRCVRDERAVATTRACESCAGRGHVDLRDPFSADCRACAGTGVAQRRSA